MEGDTSVEPSHPHRINIRPGVSVLSVLRHLNYQPWFALAEFVDNSIQSFLTNRVSLTACDGDAYQLRVEIRVEPDCITVRDNAGGIALPDFSRAFRPAEIPPDRSQLSEFGMGMKAASCWFSPTWHVRTSALGETVERTVRFDIDRIVRNSLELIDVAEQPTQPNHHFTEIVLERLHKPLASRTLTKVKLHLGDIYREFFRSGDLELKLNDEILRHEEPKVLAAPFYKDLTGPSRVWRKEVSFDFGLGQKVTGFAAIREVASSSRAGFALFRRHRLIQGSGDEGYRPEKVFGKPNDFRYQRIFGELHLEGFNVSHTKDGIVWADYEDDFLELLKERLRADDLPLLQQAEEFRVRRYARDVRQHGEAAVQHTAETIEQKAPPVLASIGKEQPGESLPQHLRPVSESSQRTLDINFEGVKWKIIVVLSYDPAQGEWLEVSDTSSESDDPRVVGIRVAMTHPFMDRFCANDTTQIEALLRVAASMALGEVMARDGGVELAGTVRRNMNKLLRQALSQG